MGNKNAIRLSLLAVVVALLAVHLQGCVPAAGAAGGAVAVGVGFEIWNILKPAVPAILHAAGYEASLLGLKKLQPETGKIVAGVVVTVSADAIKYLDTGNLPTADIVNQTITGIFGDSLDPLVLAELDAVAETLGRYVPSSAQYLTADQIGYLKAFLQGLQDGARAYLADQNTPVKLKYTLSREQAKAHKKLMATPYQATARRWFQRE